MRHWPDGPAGWGRRSESFAARENSAGAHCSILNGAAGGSSSTGTLGAGECPGGRLGEQGSCSSVHLQWARPVLHHCCNTYMQCPPSPVLNGYSGVSRDNSSASSVVLCWAEWLSHVPRAAMPGTRPYRAFRTLDVCTALCQFVAPSAALRHVLNIRSDSPLLHLGNLSSPFFQVLRIRTLSLCSIHPSIHPSTSLAPSS